MTRILKVILFIALCVICIILFYWFGKQITEGFQAASSQQTDVELARGLCLGTSGSLSSGVTTTIQTNVALFTVQARMTNYAFNQPVSIWLENSGTSAITTGFLFSYNHPTLAIHSPTNVPNPWTITGTGVTWSAGSTERPFTTSYIIKAGFCTIEANKTNSACITANTNPIPPETPVETIIYDTYELYNFDTTVPPPIVTQATPYDMASELGSFDSGAPTPWDYENRMYQPEDVLWGNIHPNVSNSIFETAYTREVLQSINNLDYNETAGWTYTSLLFEQTWTGDDRKFLPAIQVAEFVAQTALSMAVPMVTEGIEGKLYTDTAWGRSHAAIIDRTLEGNAVRNYAYQNAIDKGMLPSEAKIQADNVRTTHIRNLEALDSLSDADRAAVDRKFFDSIGDDGVGAREATPRAYTENIGNRTNYATLEAANKARFDEAENLRAKSVTANAAASAGAEALDGIPGKDTAVTRSASAASQLADVKPRVSSGSQSRGISSLLLKVLGKKTTDRLASQTSGKLAVKFANAIGVTIEAGGLAQAAVASYCTAFAAAGPAGYTACFTTGTNVVIAINIFLNLFVLSCCTFIPAILATYIPDDAVCPPGYFNIRDAMTQLTGGELGWQIVSAIPGLGDALGTFGPYLCTNTKGETVLKRPRDTPAYFYDSTTTIFTDKTKSSMSPDTPQFTDRRKYTRNSLSKAESLRFPYWRDSTIPPIWVDFSDFRMLDKMADFYYKYARGTAEDNLDGTFTFEYISKFFGVITSSDFTCDVQCEITSVTYYSNTGIQKSKTIVPVDPTNGTTYHDRRFYFYPVQVENTELEATNPARISAKNIEAFYSKEPYRIKFMSWADRKKAVSTSGTDGELNLLMSDNVNRFIVTACTHVDGTAPNAIEVNNEGEYVGDALISLGDSNAEYYPPELSLNTSYLAALSNAITNPIDLAGATSGDKIFQYVNPLILFVPGDSVEGVKVNNPTQSILVAGNVDQSKKFTGTVKSYSSGTPQTVTVTLLNNTIPAGSAAVSIRVTARTAQYPAMNDNGCSAMRSKASRSGMSVNNDPSKGRPDDPPPPSYAITQRSSTSKTWTPSVPNTRKIWNETKVGEITSTNAQALGILQGTAVGFVGYRLNVGGIPVGAIIAQGILPTNFSPDWSIASLISCSYQDMMQANGTYVLNGVVTSIEMCYSCGTNNTGTYVYVDRGPTIAFAPGYTPTINKRIVKVTQVECANRHAIRDAIIKYNTANTDEQVSKVLNIEADSTNSQCLYVLETTGFNRAQNARNSTTNTKVEVIGYTYSDSELAQVPNPSNIQFATLNSDGVIVPPINGFVIADKSTDFSIVSPSMASDSVSTAQIVVPATTTRITDAWNISRPGNRLNNQTYTCDTPSIKNRLRTQFNLKYNGKALIRSITASYYPVSGSKQPDGTFICAYDTIMASTERKRITMTIVPAKDPDLALYDLAYDDYPAVYKYSPIPKPDQWISIPPPLIPETSILRPGCTLSSISTCADPLIIANLVGQYNNKIYDGKIMKVRKAYTPVVSDANVCDYEIEMLRTFNTQSTITQKESIRLPIVASTTDVCLWDLNISGSNASPPNTGISLTNSPAVPLLDAPYVWAPSILSNIRESINGALLNYLNVPINNILSNTAITLNREVVNVYQTLATAQTLYHPDPTCIKTCKDLDVMQSIIDRYYVDNYPTGQYGAQRRTMTEIRRAGTFNTSTCQIEFIEKQESYENFISSPIFTTDPTNPKAALNTKYFLRQYQFTTIPVEGQCAHAISSIANIVSTNSFYKMDLSGNALGIQSDASKVTNNAQLNFKGKPVDCAHINVLNAVKNRYNTIMEYIPLQRPSKYNILQSISTSFNPQADTCEYTATVGHWFKSLSGSLYMLRNIHVTLTAQWGSYDYRTGLDYSNPVPDVLIETDPAKTTSKIQPDGSYTFYNYAGQVITLPYTYQLRLPYDTTRISTLKYSCSPTGICSTN